MNEVVRIKNHELQVKEYKGQRVVTFKDIDECHSKADGSAKRRFNENKKRFIEGIDYFVISKKMSGTNSDGHMDLMKKHQKAMYWLNLDT